MPPPPTPPPFPRFKNFQDAAPGTPLYDKGMARIPDIVSAFAADMDAGTLPAVSWIVGPTNLSEHATNHPQVRRRPIIRRSALLASP